MRVLIGAIISYLVWYFIFPTLRVRGSSMHPIYQEGDKLVTLRWAKFNRLKIGKVYVYHAPKDEGRLVIKRLKKINNLGECYFLGDNPQDSFDSRHYGYVSSHNILSVVLIHLPKRRNKICTTTK